MRRQDLLDLNDVLQHPGRKLSVDISTELADEADIDLAGPIEGYIDAVSSGNLLFITGEFKTSIHSECARCAAPLTSAIEFEIDEQFGVEGIPSSLSAQDFAKVVLDEPFELFDGNSLMVEDLIRQDLIIAVPPQILCAYGWDGNCPAAAARLQALGSVVVGQSPPKIKGLENFLNKEDSA